MPVYETVVTDGDNLPVAGAKGYVYVDGVLASLTDDLAAPLGNPLTSDSLGYVKATVPSSNFTVKWNWLGRERLIENFLAGIDGGEATAANIASAASSINTSGKLLGTLVWDTTNNRMMRAMGASAISPWRTMDGLTVVTPV